MDKEKTIAEKAKPAAEKPKISSPPEKQMPMAEKPKASRPNSLYFVAVIVIAVVAIGVYYAINISAASVVAAGDNVSVYYTGKFTNGTVFGTNVGATPLNFTVGAHQLITGFDQGVVGMRLNQTKNITVSPIEGYGEVNQSLIVTVPLSRFGNQSVTLGMRIQTAGGAQGVVTLVNATNATVNFNPPLAGKTLVFQIRVVKIAPKK